ncbi:MAG: PKD domain-containing protein [Halobacteriales archaeon]|nr:PKD domain-containing protein [Halobacteriales archaeon]
MTRFPLPLALVSVVLLALIVPTGATGGDHLWTEPDVVLRISSGGPYASLDAGGELEVDLSNPGVNAEAVTVVDGVFTVSNEDDMPVGIWFSHAEPDDIVLSVEGRSAQDEIDPVVLSPGEQVAVDLTVDTGAHPADSVVLSSFTINAKNATDVDDRDDGGATPAGGGVTSSVSTMGNGSVEGVPTVGPDRPAIPSPITGGDQVVFVDGEAEGAIFTSMDAAEVAALDDRSGFDGPPRAVIDAVSEGKTFATDLPTADGYHGVALVGEGFRLTAGRTVFASVEAVQPEETVARLVDVDVPADRRDEPALVRLSVDRDRLAGADPTAARLARHTGSGWQVLPTKVVSTNDARAVLQARTPGFGPFAVFPDPAIGYDWRLPDGGKADGVSARTRFDEPGGYEVLLAVTDARGRTATTSTELLANDRPSVTVVVPDGAEPDEPIVLRAAVIDEVGEVTVTWRFADGTTVLGRAVERSFPGGEHVVRVLVEDEYGATASTSTTLTVGPAARIKPPLEVAPLGLAFQQRLSLAAVTIALVLIITRLVSGHRSRRRRRRS